MEETSSNSFQFGGNSEEKENNCVKTLDKRDDETYIKYSETSKENKEGNEKIDDATLVKTSEKEEVKNYDISMSCTDNNDLLEKEKAEYLKDPEHLAAVDDDTEEEEIDEKADDDTEEEEIDDDKSDVEEEELADEDKLYSDTIKDFMAETDEPDDFSVTDDAAEADDENDKKDERELKDQISCETEVMTRNRCLRCIQPASNLDAEVCT